MTPGTSPAAATAADCRVSAEPFQLFRPLDAATEGALRESIRRFGVLVPVARDQHGRTLDGYHRSRIADELGVSYRVDVVTVTDDEEAREIARTLNADRRHLTREQQREVARFLREQGHSLRAIAKATDSTLQKVQLAVAKAIDVHYDAFDPLLDRDRGDVAGLHVRSTEHLSGHLTIYRDGPGGTYVLVVGRIPCFRVAGWIEKADAVATEQWWRSDIRDPAFWVPQAALAPIQVLALRSAA